MYINKKWPIICEKRRWKEEGVRIHLEWPLAALVLMGSPLWLTTTLESLGSFPSANASVWILAPALMPRNCQLIISAVASDPKCFAIPVGQHQYFWHVVWKMKSAIWSFEVDGHAKKKKRKSLWPRELLAICARGSCCLDVCNIFLKDCGKLELDSGRRGIRSITLLDFWNTINKMPAPEKTNDPSE